MPNVLSSPVGGLHWTKSSPILGVITMLPALSPTQTVSLSDGKRSARPDCRIQWQRYRASPPFTSRTSVSRTQLAHGCGRLTGDETPCPTGTALRVAVPRRGDTEGVGLGNRFAEEIDQRVVDGRVLDASGREKKPHAASGCQSF